MENSSHNQKVKDISIVLCGQAGQGIQTVERLLTKMLKFEGYNIFATKEYMSRVRGGMNSTMIRMSEKPVQALIDRIDILVPLDKGSAVHLNKRITSQTIILGDKNVLGDEFQNASRFFDVPFMQIASDTGDRIYFNTVAVGALTNLLGLKLETILSLVRQYFSEKSDDVVGKNSEAAKKGYEASNRIIQSNNIKLNIENHPAAKEHMLINGAEAVGLGAIAGGCNFVSSYPMSPSTAVLVFLAQNIRDFGGIVEQAEDEIAAINMAIGAWYAGARAMVTTSGGGFALMIEGLSLAGMLEMPLVIHLAQRPGPATGLPTRTEQGDLELALYAGHGEFPRIIFTPGTLEDGFYLTQKAFDLADKYQIPVFILTDQYFIDSYYNIEAFDLANLNVKQHFVETSKNYRRYELTESGISPRGIPGFGQGLVCVDSDEHDQDGHITENLEMRTAMVDKRLGKLELMKDEIIPPKVIGPDNFKNLIICWGSTFNIVCEAVNNLGRNDTSILYFNQVYPLHSSTTELINKANKTIVVENNATAQFARLLKTYTGITTNHTILKYNGLAFASDELAKKLDSVL